ncbi:MAG: hypothetical protein ACMZ7B_01715 [Balneola sp.]
MKDFLETTTGKIILGVVVAAIWGVNLVNFSQLSDDSVAYVASEVQRIDMDALMVPANVNYAYKASARDPFRRPGTSLPVREEANIQQEKQQEFNMPELVLAGIFDGMAVISDNLGQSFFVEYGDEFKDGIKVKEIVQDSVVLEYQKRNIILKLN